MRSPCLCVCVCVSVCMYVCVPLYKVLNAEPIFMKLAIYIMAPESILTAYFHNPLPLV
jgi:hypothetical protein